MLMTDNWVLAVLDDACRRDLLEVLDERQAGGSSVQIALA